jgi:WD40 repeat protein
MTKRIILTLTMLTLLASFICLTINPLNTVDAIQTIVQLKWTNPMTVYDMAVSDDGNYVASVNNTGLYYFNADNSQPVWWYQPPTVIFRSVAISVDGDYVVTGDDNGFLHYFNQSRIRTSSQALPTWISYDMGGPVERGTLDMSANGNYTVVGGTGINMWYYGDCLNRAGANQTATWVTGIGWEFLSVHISANGKYVAGGGRRSMSEGYVVFFENATTMSSYNPPKWYAWSQLYTQIFDLALSDDGYAVAAISADLLTLHYWANATNLTGDPNATWTNLGPFSCVDMSSNGDNVVAGGYIANSLHFWGNARTRQGMQQEDWVRLQAENVLDVAISSDASLIAGPTMNETGNFTAYFLAPNGTVMFSHPILELSNMVSMSTNGTTIAIAGPGYDSLYLFKMMVDATPPAINEITQQPDKDNVYPNNTVNVFANVTDDLSGVQRVTLNFTTGNGTWFTMLMEPYSRDIWNGTIPAFPHGTTITYIIIAEDNANNTITSQELGYTLQYNVIPELTAVLALLLFMAAALIAATSHRRKSKTPT